ncbi:MAG: transglutaminase domain-containing protein, partial [Pseudomonadota bacterium]
MKAAAAIQDHPHFEAQSAMTSPGRHAALFEHLPDEIADLVDIVQQLIIYDVVAPEFYGFKIPEQRQDEIHIRSVEELLGRILELDDRPLTVPRPVEMRVAGRCHHYVLLLLAMIRSRGIRARARCGFGAYFNPPSFEDHWVCEYWDSKKSRWVLVDPQFDEVWRAKLSIRHDVLDVPRDQFLVAADAWTQCRAGHIKPARFGISFVKMHGLWYVAGNLIRDVAALNQVETLPWDVWGAQPPQNASLDDAQRKYFD